MRLLSQLCLLVVSYAAVNAPFVLGGALREDTRNGCVGGRRLWKISRGGYSSEALIGVYRSVLQILKPYFRPKYSIFHTQECSEELSEKLSYPLALLFNMFLKSERVPSLWKRANVTPVFKSGARDMVENYRPISLLSIPSRCQEKIAHNAIYSRVAPFLTNWQHGFVKGRS